MPAWSPGVLAQLFQPALVASSFPPVVEDRRTKGGDRGARSRSNREKLFRVSAPALGASGATHCMMIDFFERRYPYVLHGRTEVLVT